MPIPSQTLDKFRSEWSDISEAEHDLLRLTQIEERLSLGLLDTDDHTAGAQSWDDSPRRLRLSFLLSLLRHKEVQQSLHPVVTIRNVYLELSSAPFSADQNHPFDLRLENCTFVGWSSIEGIKIRSLTLKECSREYLGLKRSTIEGDLFINGGNFGTFSLEGITIKQNFVISKPLADAIYCSRISVGGKLAVVSSDAASSLLLSVRNSEVGSFGCHGVGWKHINLSGTKFDDDCDFIKVSFIESSVKTGATLNRVKVGKTLRWIGVRVTATTTLDLTDLEVHAFEDDQGSWVHQGNLFLKGFRYSEIKLLLYKRREGWVIQGYEELAPSFGPLIQDDEAVGPRLSWLNKQPNMLFSTQPYNQYGNLLIKNGRRPLAKRVLCAGVEQLRKRFYTGRSEKLWTGIMRNVAGHGYMPERSLFWISIWVIFGALIFGIAHGNGQLANVRGDGVPTTFNALVYSIDAFIPIIDLRQEEYWVPSGRTAIGHVAQIYGWLHTIAGWMLTTIAVAAFSGLLQKVE